MKVSDHGGVQSLYREVFEKELKKLNKMLNRDHMFRLFALTVLFMTVFSFLIFLTRPSKCIQISVSVQQYHSFPLKRTRVVQAFEDPGSNPESHHKAYSNRDAFFRARLVSSESIQEPDDIDEELDSDIDIYENDDSDDYDDLSDNKIFEEGDFDYNETIAAHSNFSVIRQMFYEYKNSLGSGNTTKTLTSYSSPNTTDEHADSHSSSKLKHKIRNITLINIEGIPIVEDRIYWSEELENESPKGYGDSEAQASLHKLRTSQIKRVEPPTWNRCGRPKNQFIVFEDNSKACARYRSPHQYLVQGEILSFYLARLLGITHVPIVALSMVKEDFRDQWSRESVKKNLMASKWETNTTVALIEWIENLERDKLPNLLLSALVRRKSLSANNGEMLKLSAKKIVELLQWSDLILFDYITGNYDRVASMQDAADKEKRPSILNETIHNLVRSKTSGALWLIDNESGLLDSYSLLYGQAGQDGRFLTFHQQMLNTTCIFRRSTVERIRWLHDSKRAGHILWSIVERLEPLFTPIKNFEEVSRRLQERISEVKRHIDNCLLKVS